MPAVRAILVLRILVATLLFIHGAARVAAGGVAPFGGFLAGAGFPAGPALAWAITLFELIASPALAAGVAVRPIALAFAAELVMGIALVHAREGWFVVGLGRNGAEYSVALIGLLLAQAWAAGGPRRPAA
jgi:putative oxidoreductase